MVAIHDSGSDGRHWHGLADCLEDRFRLSAPDLPALTAEVGIELSTHADPVLYLMRSLGRPVHLVGEGYGAALALWVALRRPGSVRSLTLIAPAAYHLLRCDSTADRRLFGEVMEITAAMAIMAASGDREGAIRQFVDYRNGPGAWAGSTSDVQRRLLGELDGILGHLAALAAERGTRAELGSLSCPALTLVGFHEVEPCRRVAEIIAASVPWSDHRVVSGGCRRLTISSPHVLASMIAVHAMAAEQTCEAVGRVAA